MPKNFDELSKELDLKSPAADDDLQKLMDWFEATVSTDFYCEGDVQERFSFYRTLSSDFLVKIKPNIQTDNLTASVPALNNWSSLQCIVTMGLDSYLKALKPSAEQINAKVNGNSLLVLAASEGNVHTTEALLSLGIDPREKIIKGPPLLFVALALPIEHDEQMIKNKVSIYKLLSPYFKAIGEERNQVGDTILHTMSLFGYDELTEKLLADAQTKGLVFTSNNSIHYPIHTAILNAQHQCAKLLLAVEGVAQLTDAKGRNPLHYAALHGNSEMVKVCLPHCSIDSTDKRQQTPLILAARRNNSVAIKELQASGADVNAIDDEERSALHYAVESNNLEAVTELLQNPNINVNLSDIHSNNPLDLVKLNAPRGAQISDLLTQHGATHYQDNGSSFCH